MFRSCGNPRAGREAIGEVTTRTGILLFQSWCRGRRLPVLERRWLRLRAAVPSQGKSSDEGGGLFAIRGLEKPNDFVKLGRRAVQDCEAFKQRILTSPPSLDTLRHLDDISNSICSVVDAAELCRNVHPEREFREEANKCFSELSQYIQLLNANVDLYNCLSSVTHDDSMMSNFTDEQKRMGILLRAEFERDGIHLSNQKRQEVMHLQNEITRLGMDFQHQINSSTNYVQTTIESLRGIPQHYLTRCKVESNGTVLVPTDTQTVNGLLKWVRNPQTRRAIFVAGNSGAPENLETLEQLRKRRHELALLLDFESYAHFAMSDKMAGNPESVYAFLESFGRNLMSKAQREKEILLRAKSELEGPSNDLFGWDVPFYMGMLKARQFNLDARVISSYFQLEKCMEGLSHLCEQLFGITCTEVPMSPNESWHSDVTKVALTHQTDGVLGHIYFDLYPRPHKYNHAAHFTIRCGRQISSTAYQTPVVALVCNFSRSAPNQPSLLSHSEVETLFHEFGHAMHSILSRTEFQHLSGTRAQLDFVETPSHIFEYFAWDHRFVRMFARHYRTGEPIPQEMMTNLKQSKNMFAAMDAQTQTMYSHLDLALFGSRSEDRKKSSTTIFKELHNQYTLIPYEDGTHWHTRFGHLVGYGAGYYSYLYAKVFSADIWKQSLAEDPMSKKAGTNLRRMMMWGGSKDPNKILFELLGREPSMQSFLDELGV